MYKVHWYKEEDDDDDAIQRVMPFIFAIYVYDFYVQAQSDSSTKRICNVHEFHFLYIVSLFYIFISFPVSVCIWFSRWWKWFTRASEFDLKFISFDLELMGILHANLLLKSSQHILVWPYTRLELPQQTLLIQFLHCLGPSNLVTWNLVAVTTCLSISLFLVKKNF